MGKLEDGTVVEDLKNAAVQVGDVEVVQGLDMSIPLMCVGELAEISAESRFAYGAQGLTNENDNTKSIPPNAKVHNKPISIRVIGFSELLIEMLLFSCSLDYIHCGAT